MQNKIKQIRDMFIYLPEKDIKLANALLDKRKFVELKEIIDSDIPKVREALIRIMPTDENGERTPEYLVAESKYNKLKDLQYEVTQQALAFIDKDDEPYIEDTYYVNDYEY